MQLEGYHATVTGFPKNEGSTTVPFSDLVREIILLVTQRRTESLWWGTCTRKWIAGGKDNWLPSWKLTTTPLLTMMSVRWLSFLSEFLYPILSVSYSIAIHSPRSSWVGHWRKCKEKTSVHCCHRTYQVGRIRNGHTGYENFEHMPIMMVKVMYCAVTPFFKFFFTTD
jgi:hypothetical protein